MPGLDLARAGGHEHARAGDLDDADAADVDRRQVLEVAERRRVDALRAAGLEDRRAGRHATRRAPSIVSSTGSAARSAAAAPSARRLGRGPAGSSGMPVEWSTLASLTAPPAPAAGTRSRSRSDAVWPRPQIDASRIAWPISRRRASSSSRGSPAASAAGQARQQLLLAHRPDPARDALAARLVAEERPRSGAGCRRGRRVSSKTITTPEPSVAPIARVPSNVSGMSSASGPTKTPAAPPSRMVRMSRSASGPRHAAGEVDELAQGRPERRPRRRPVARRGRSGRRASGRSSPRCRSPRTPRRRRAGSGAR